MVSFFTKLKTGLGIILVLCVGLAVCGCGGGGGGAKKDVMLDPPSNVAASDGLYNDKVVISWNPVAGASKYKVYRSDNLSGAYTLLDTESSASYTDSSVTYQQQYYYKISTVSSASAEGDKTANPDSGYSDAATLLTVLATKDSTSNVSLAWTSSNQIDVFTFNVYRGTSLTGSFEKIADSLTTDSYDDITAVQGTYYMYKVQSVSVKGSLNFSNAVDGYVLLVAPLSVSAADGTSTSFTTVSWSAVSNASSYKVYRSATSGGTFLEIASGVTSSSYNDSSSNVIGNNASTNFYYKVAAVSADALVGLQSSSDAGYTSLAYPANFSATDGKYYGSVVLTWSAVAGADSYKVYCGTTVLYSGTALTFKDTSLSDSTPTTYKVCSVKNSLPSIMAADLGNKKDPAENQSFSISWLANKEAAVNRVGGGYRIYKSKNSDFSLSSVAATVPFNSGTAAPTTASISFSNAELGTNYVRVQAYSNIDSSVSEYSAVTSLVVE